jgi:electron transfer flavoprotein alpha subunit
MIFGGGALRTERVQAKTALVTIASGVFSPHAETPGKTIEIRDIPSIEPAWKVKVRDRKPLAKASVNLQAARRVVSAGRGIANQADLEMVKTLAGLLSAEIGCTRPLAEGLDWLPRERYIGISGAHIKPDLYFGVGVSGQVQHMIGMNGSRVVIAVNKDPNAPIFSQADYGVVADLYAFIPSLIKALQARAGSR